jgi:hypothetical protein
MMHPGNFLATLHAVEEIRIELWGGMRQRVTEEGSDVFAAEHEKFMRDCLALFKIVSGIPATVYTGLGMIDSRLSSFHPKPLSVYRLLVTLYKEDRLGDAENKTLADRICHKHFGRKLG